MQKLNKTLEVVKNDVDNLVGSAGKQANIAIEFIKRHKKLIITIVVIYLIYRYLFTESDEEWKI